MDRINIALLTALFNGQSNLYSEIYFPVVKYALVCCLKESKDTCTSCITDLHTMINQEFGVFIPLVVVKKAIKHMTQDDKFHVTLMNDGTLQVDRADMSIFDDIQNKSQMVDSSLQRLEQSYIRYFHGLNITPEKTFVEFFSAKTQEIEDYLGNTGPNASMGEEYTHNVRYLLWLKENDFELYESANKILWGAIVAGFLGRDNYEFGVKPISKCKYYLDTAIVMGCLDLSYEQTTRYCQELLQTIKASGAIACVHPITLEEITRIIKGVEFEGKPRIDTPIYEAFGRRGLACSDLVHIRLSLEDLIKEQGVEIHPSNEDALKIGREYKGKSIVKKLEEQRSGKGTGENPRDIHDTYMIDLVRKENKGVSVKEKVKAYFVTMNDDLRKFSFEYYRSSVGNSPINFSIAPSSVILDLWLHGTTLQSRASSLSLTETMSRCLALNEQTAISRIHQVLECLAHENLNDSRIHQEIINGIIERSHRYISSGAGGEVYDKITPDIASQMYKQTEQYLNEKEERAFKMKDLQDENIKLSQENEDLEAKATKLAELLSLQSTLDELTPKRRCASRCFYFWCTIEAISNIVLLSLFIFTPSQIAPTISIWKPEWKTILEEANLWHCIVLWIILTGSLYIAIGKRSRIFYCKKYKGAWDNEHPEYRKAVDRVKEIKQELEGL